MTNEDTAIITIRVNKKIKEKIETIADLHNVNLNSMVNKILIEYADWEILKKYFDFVQIRGTVIAELLKNSDSKSLESVFKKVSTSFREKSEFVYGEFNFDNFITVVDHWLTNAGFKFRHFTINDKDSYLISHSYGKNFSKFILAIFSENLESLNYNISSQVVEGEKVSFEIQKIK